MLAMSEDDTPSDTSATAEGDSDDDHDGPIVAEMVHNDDNDNNNPSDFQLAGQH